MMCDCCEKNPAIDGRFECESCHQDMFNDKTQCLVFFGDKKMIVNCSQEQLEEGLAKQAQGILIQDAFPFLTADEREFMLTGILPEEWDAMFGEEG